MYLEFFGMSESPFPTVALSENYFGFQSMQQSLDLLKSAIQRDAGPCLVIGGAGSGKSILLDVLRRQYENNCLAICLSSTRLCTRRSLLQNLMYELGMDYQNRDEGELRLTLTQFLRGASACQSGLLLLVDEAHTLPVHLLDELRVLTNTIRQGRSVIRLVLAGSAKLEEVLAEPAMESFNQRVGCRVYLRSMSRDELANYIHFQLERVDSHTRNLFTSEAIQAIHIATDGIPRLANQLCEFALVCAAEKRVKQIDEPLIQWAWSTMQQIPCVAATVPDSGSQNQQKVTSGGEDIIQFGELDDDGPVFATPQSVAGKPEESPTVAPPAPELSDPVAMSEPEPITEVTEYYQQASQPLDSTPAADNPAVITFAFEQDIQKPIRQSHEQIEAIAETVGQMAQSRTPDYRVTKDTSDTHVSASAQLEETRQEVPAVRSREVDTDAASRRIQTTLETVSHALNSLDDDWLTVEKVLAEAELNHVVRPISSDPQKTFPSLAGEKPRPSVASAGTVEPGDVFDDHLYHEIETVDDLGWGQFLQPLPELVDQPQARLRVTQTESTAAIPMPALSEPTSGTGDDRRIIHTVQDEKIEKTHSGHTEIQPPVAQRKDLRALLTALRGY